MKIAVVTSTFPPYKGGMGNVARDHAAALERAGHDVTVFAPGENFRPLLRIGNAAVMPQLLWRLRSFESVELHYPFFGGAEWVWIWKTLFGKKKRLAIVYHMDTVGRGWLGLVFRLYRTLFLKRILKSADAIIVTSRDYLASSQAAAFKDDPRVIEVPLAVDTARFHPGGVPNPKKALFVGALDRAHYFKGLGILLDAFSRSREFVPNARLEIVGDGDLRADYERRAQELGLAGHVRFLGRVSDERLPSVYRGALFHVLPSVDRSEAFGAVTLEAMASGRPSIVSALPGVRTLVETCASGYHVPPGQAGPLASAMINLFAHPELAEEMGRVARGRAERLYASTVVEKRLLQAIRG